MPPVGSCVAHGVLASQSDDVDPKQVRYYVTVVKVALYLRGLWRRLMNRSGQRVGLSLLVMVAVAQVGCLRLSRGSRNAAATYDGEECKKVLLPLSERGAYTAEDDPTTEAQVLLAVCTRRERTGRRRALQTQKPRIRRVSAVDIYRALDDYRPDTVRIAASLILSLRDIGANSRYRTERASRKGLLATWAEIVDVAMLRSRLAETSLSPGAQSALVKNFEQARVRARAFKLTEVERELLVDIPMKVYRARQAHYGKHAAHYARLTKLTDNLTENVSDEHVASLRTLRREMLADCEEHACEDIPLVASATKALATLHILRNERLAARAESMLFRANGSYRSGFAQAVRVAQDKRVRRLREIHEAFKRARQNGSSEAVADEIAGGRGARIRSGLLLSVEMRLPNYAAAIDKSASRTRVKSATVAALGLSPGGAIVRFEEGNGRYRKRKKPVVFPRADVKGLRPGDVLHYVTLEKEARTVRATRKKVLIHLRDATVPPHSAPDDEKR